MLKDLAAPGSLVAWWSAAGELQIAVVGGEEKRKIRLVLAGGQEVRVPPSRLAFRIEPAGPIPGKTPEALRAAGERASAMAEQIRQQSASCDVGLLWEIAAENRQVYSVEALTELAFSSGSGSRRAALVQALLDDGIHFARKGEGWEPRAPESVQQLRLQRRRTAERAQAKQAFFDSLSAAVAGRGFQLAGSEPEGRYLGALRDLAIHDLAASDRARSLALEALEASAIRYDRPHEGAFRLLRLLGHFDSDDENLQLLHYGLKQAFPADVLEHARRVAASGFSRAGRADLTGLEVVTIDSPHTREIDDGLSLEELTAGRSRLGIHIADPAAFLLPDDPVDREALARAVTHYLPDRKLLMIPDAISEDAASLVPGQERPALSFVLELDERGEVADYGVVRSVIRSCARLSYEEADRAFRDSSGPYARLLKLLFEVLMLCGRRRIEAGAIRILAPEVDVYVDGEGRVQLERLAADSPARRCVAEAMVLGGAMAARYCFEREIPAIYRRQPAPPQPVEVPREGLANPVVVRAARRALRRGEVGLQPGPHYALGLPAYAQASSPLRRYQDLATHRQIVSVLEGRVPLYDAQSLQRIAATTEQAEIDSRRVEQSANRYWLLRYLEQREDGTVFGVVVELEPRPVVHLDETLIEQPVPGLQGAELGARIELRVERVNARAGLLVLRGV